MPLLHALDPLIEQNVLVALLVLAIAFAVLAKCADLFVESAVGIARRFRVPKLVVGIVLVSLATTAPELSVSLIAALRGSPEMALGNAIGSVICDDGVGLGLAGLFAAGPIMVIPAILRTSGAFLVAVQVALFAFVVRDGVLNRWQGAVLVGMFAGYLLLLYRQYRRGVLSEEMIMEEVDAPEGAGMGALAGMFALGLAGIVLASEFIVTSATSIAHFMNIPDAVIALTLVALGTSIPEFATCVVAARKGHGEIAVGNILGADILNICWVAGASAIANPLALGRREIYFMYPSMFVIVGAMLIMLWSGYRLTRRKSIVLLGLYTVYIASFFVLYGPGH